MVKNLVHSWEIVEVLQLQLQNMQNDSIYMSVGIVGLLSVWARQCISTPSLQNGCIFGSQDAWFHVPMLPSADTINNFSLENQIKLTIEAG